MIPQVDFELSPAGYLSAIAWLRANDQTCVLNHDIPLDCYTIVTKANEIKHSLSPKVPVPEVM